MHLSKFLHTTTGRIILSIILGFGLASLFRQVCKGKNCYVFKAPSLEETKNQTFKYDGKCYSYNQKQVKCDKTKRIVRF